MCVLLSSTNRTSRASLINYLPAQTSYLKRVELLMEFYIVDNSNKVLIVFGVKKKNLVENDLSRKRFWWKVEARNFVERARLLSWMFDNMRKLVFEHGRDVYVSQWLTGEQASWACEIIRNSEETKQQRTTNMTQPVATIGTTHLDQFSKWRKRFYEKLIALK